MLRCPSCNGILTKSETTCFTCGEKTATTDKSKGAGFNTVASVVFYISLALTVLSIFTNFAPPLSVCAPVTVILLFVKSSADQLRKNQT